MDVFTVLKFVMLMHRLHQSENRVVVQPCYYNREEYVREIEGLLRFNRIAFADDYNYEKENRV